MDQVPAGLKSIAPYILRAKEVALVEPLISYYCLFYAVKTGLGLNFNDPDSQAYLSNLLDNLEKIAEKIKYAKYRAAEIYKANRLNTTVAPPPQQQQNNDSIISDSNELPSAPTSHNNISDTNNSADVAPSNSFSQPPTSSNTTPSTNSSFTNQQPTNSTFSNSSTSNNNSNNDFISSNSNFNSNPNSNNNSNSYSNSNPNNNNNFNSYSNSNPNNNNNFNNTNNSNFSNYSNNSSNANTIDFESTKLAQKHAKWAISALEYDDTQTALVNLQKAIDIISKFNH
ncbi:hypothetical protein AYI70_g4902 [Smittium culicis]|uniref:Vacuolar protein sorting-associated protein VTA1-like protein n=2 Tax=Smittium culicis TaxID=133412 RepID=A0A1R1XX23_9FUNG|nr:hypothetical protein AYI70_g4902 [Smittium culicis]